MSELPTRPAVRLSLSNCARYHRTRGDVDQPLTVLTRKTTCTPLGDQEPQTRNDNSEGLQWLTTSLGHGTCRVLA